MKRLQVHCVMAATCLLLAGPWAGAMGASPVIPPSAGPAGSTADGITPVETKPPTCRPELQPDTSCRFGFRTDQVCYRGASVVSRKIGPCVDAAPTKPAKPPQPPTPPKAPG